MNSNEKIAVGWIDGGQIYSGFAAHLSHLILNRNERISDIVVGSGPYLSYNRNKMVELFLKTKAEWLFAVDTDLKITLKDFDQLCETADSQKRPIVGGKYYLPFLNGTSMQASAQQFGPAGQPYGNWLPVEATNSNQPIEGLHSVGFGYGLYHRSVFEAVFEAREDKTNVLPWFRDFYASEVDMWISDDVYFFIQLHKLLPGTNVTFEPRATSTHLKVMALSDDSFLSVRTDFNSAAAHDHPHQHVHELPSKRVSWWAKNKKNQ
jgi:hypothetical protein